MLNTNLNLAHSSIVLIELMDLRIGKCTTKIIYINSIDLIFYNEFLLVLKIIISPTHHASEQFDRDLQKREGGD